MVEMGVTLKAVTAGALNGLYTDGFPGSDGRNPPYYEKRGFMKIKHEHIRMAMNARAHPDGEKFRQLE